MTAVGSAPPDDHELVEVLEGAFNGQKVVALRRRRYAYATSARLEELDVTLSDGDVRTLIFKDLAWEHRLEDARAIKPRSLHEPRRDIDTYTHILAGEEIGPRCYAAIAEPGRGRQWLLLEKVPGVELWQIGEVEVWEDVAHWLGQFHTRFADDAAALHEANPYLLEYGRAWYRQWWKRADAELARSADPRAPTLRRALDTHEHAVDEVDASSATLVHGEFYPANVLVRAVESDVDVWPVDWEMSGTGAGARDLAALVSGWGSADQDRFVAAYRSEAPPTSDHAIACARLHLALQWIAWSPHWDAPREHASDWIGEALGVVRELAP